MLTTQQKAKIYGSFTEYCKYMVPLLNNEHEWQWFHELMANTLDRKLKENKGGTLIIECPPQHGKTLIAGQLLISYYMAKHPNRYCLYATHSSDRAINFTKQELMPHFFSEKYKALFGHIKLKYDLTDNDKKSKETRKTATLSDNAFSLVGHRGRYLAVGVGQSISGYPASLIVTDDFFGSAADSNSEVIRSKVNTWYKRDIEARAQSNTLKIIFCTRWNSEDIIGMVLKEAAENEDPNYQYPEVITLPAQLEVYHDKHDYDPRQPGDYLWDIYKFKYASAKKDEGTWNALYQQEPLDTKGLVLKAEHLKFYSEYIRPMNVYISIDTNFKAESESGDKCGITIWQHSEPYKYLIDAVYAKLDFNQLLDVVAQIIQKYPMYNAIIIEEKANGRALYELLRKKFARCISYKLGTNSKMERFQWCLPEFIAGNVLLPMAQELPVVSEYKRQLLAFTGAKGGKDDLVDSTSMFLNWLRENCITLHSGNNVEFIGRSTDTTDAAMAGSKETILNGLGAINIDISEIIDYN